MTASSVLVKLMSVFSLPILTALLSPKAYGGAALASTLISLVAVVALGGIDMSYARAYPGYAGISQSSVEAFTWRYALGTSALAGVVAALAWWWLLADRLAVGRYLAPLIGVGIVLAIGNTMSSTRARLRGRYRHLAAAIILGGLLSVGVSLSVSWWWRQDELPLVLALLVTYLVPIVVLGSPGIRQLLAPSGLASTQRSDLLKIGLAGVVTAPMYWFLSSADRWFLGYFCDPDTVGIYSVAYNLAALGAMANAAILAVWLPEAAREYEADPDLAQVQLGRLMSRLIAGIALIWLAVTAAGGDLVRLLANERFHEAGDYVGWIAGGVFFYGVMQFGSVGLLLSKRLGLAIVWWLLGGVVCVLLNLALIPRFGGLGAAITQAATFAVVAGGVLGTSQRIYPMRLEWNGFVRTAVVVVVLGVVMAPSWHPLPVVSLLMKLPVGIAATLLIGHFSANDWLQRGIIELHNRLGRV
ncbi:MAG: lipopolysaccharide biosynthesis protein [Gammaproteobacteria bacterium]